MLLACDISMQLNESSLSSIEVIYEKRYKQIRPIGKGCNGTVNLVEDLKNRNRK